MTNPPYTRFDNSSGGRRGGLKWRGERRMRPGALIAATPTAALAFASAAETYRGIDVAPEHRCADYRYSQSLERRIVASIGKVYGLYAGACFGTCQRL